VVLEEEGEDKQVMIDKPEVPFKALVAAALKNADINTADCIHAARAAGNNRDRAGAPALAQEPSLVEAYNDKIVYDITFHLPNAGLILPNE
jgi:hypothetical protein